MAKVIQNMQMQFKKSSQSLGLWFLKLISGFMLGLVLSIAGEQVVGYSNFAFWFVIILFTGAFLRVSKKWSIGGLFVYNLVCVLLALLLKMYILIAPGA